MQDPDIEVMFKPGTGRALAYGWNKMKMNFLIFFLTVLVVSIVQAPLHLYDTDSRHDRERIVVEVDQGEDVIVTQRDEGTALDAFFSLLLFAYALLLVPVIKYGADLIFVQGVRGDSLKIKDIGNGFYNYLHVVLASLLVFALIGIGFIVFVIPGIYVACRLAFVSYLVIDEGLDPIEAVEGSWRITRGHAWKIFALGFISVLICIVGLALMVVGIFPAIMWVKASFAAMYLSITQQGTGEQVELESDLVSET